MTTAYIRTSTGGFVLVTNTIRAAGGTTYDVANDVRAADGVSTYTIFGTLTTTPVSTMTAHIHAAKAISHAHAAGSSTHVHKASTD